MKTIKLTKGLSCKVDDEDYKELSKFKWYAHKANVKYYAARTVKWAEAGKRKSKIVYMHRWIKKAPVGILVDHRDTDGLNNQKNNLRRCSTFQNAANTSSFGASRFKGVSLAEKVQRGNGACIQRWRAKVVCRGVCYSLGRFDTQEEAATAYDNKAFELFEEFAFLNFPNKYKNERGFSEQTQETDPPF